MSYKEFYNAYRNNDLGSAVFIYGSEDFLIEWAENLIIEKYVAEEYRDYDVVRFDGDSCDIADIASATRTYSMFSDKRVVVIKNYPSIFRKNDNADVKDDEYMLELTAEVKDSAIIVHVLEAKYHDEIKAWGKKLIANCRSFEFGKLDRNELKAWIGKRVHAKGKLIGRREIDYIAELSGYCYRNSDYNLKRLAGDIEKLCDATQDESISMSIIDELMIGADDKFVFSYIDALMTGNKAGAMVMAANILRDDYGAAMQLLSLLTKQLEIMYDALELSGAGMSMSAMAKAAGINEYRFRKAFQAARGFSMERLKKLIIELYNIDRDIKLGNIDADIAFELFTACF